MIEAKEKINFLEIDGYSKEVFITEFKNRARFTNGVLEHFDKNKLNFVYIIFGETEYPYIIKCPIVNSTNISYEVRIKDRHTCISNDAIRYSNGELYKIKKKDIDCNIYTSSTYNLALVRLLQLEKNKILSNLEDTNNSELYKLYIQASQQDLFFGLEFIARKLKMDYIFKFEDDSN